MSCSDRETMLGKSLIQFSFDGWGCVPSLFDLRPNYGGYNEGNGELLQKIPHPHCYTQFSLCCGRPLPTHTSSGDSWTLTGKSGSVLWRSLLLFPGFWCTQGFVCTLQKPISPFLCKFWRLCGGVNGNLLQEGLCHTQVCSTQSPCPYSSPLLTRTSTVDTQTQFCLSLWGLQALVCTRFV